MQKKILHIAFCLLCLPLVSFGQENYNLLKSGIQKMQTENYSDAEADFRKVIENNDTINEAYFNLGNAVYKQERIEEARENYEKALSFSTKKQDKAEAYYNIGNSFMQEKEWEKSIDAYKNALKNNSKDMDTKYNLAYALEMLKKEQQQQQQNQDQEQDKDKKDPEKEDEKKDGEKKEDEKDKGDKEKKSDEEKDGEKKEDDKDDKDDKGEDEKKEDGEPKDEEKQGKPKEMKLSKEEAERLLRAIENEEQKLQDKKKQDEMEPIRIQTEKDW